VSTPSGWPAVLAVARTLVVWSVWAAATWAAMGCIERYGRNLPMWEDVLIVPVMTGHQPLSLEWAATQYNEHRMVIPKFILAALLRAVPDFRAALYLNVALLSAGAASMLILARRLRGSTRAFDAVLPLSILNIGQAECFLIGFALNLVMTAWISCELLGVVGRSTRAPGWWTCLHAGSLLVVLPLCGGSGIALVPPLVLWLGGLVACGWWSGQGPGSLGRAFGLVLLMLTSAVVTWYMLGYVRPSHIPPPPSVAAAWATTLQAVSLILSPRLWGHWRAGGFAVMLLTAATIVRLCVVVWRSPSERTRAIGLCAVIGALLIVAASVGLSRSGVGREAGLAGRYITILAPLVCAVYLAWLVYGPAPARHAVHIGLFALVCAGISDHFRSARELGSARRSVYVKLERSMTRGVPSSRVLDLACPAIFGDRAMTYEAFKMLKDAQVGSFRYLVDDGLAAKHDELRVVR
jgi:hypothetical protein